MLRRSISRPGSMRINPNLRNDGIFHRSRRAPAAIEPLKTKCRSPHPPGSAHTSRVSIYRVNRFGPSCQEPLLDRPEARQMGLRHAGTSRASLTRALMRQRERGERK